MTGKRFYIAESNLIEGYCVFDREKKYAFHPRPRKADCLNDAHILNELHDENEELKATMQEVAELLSEEVDLFSDKATEHDINAYIELTQLDNKDAYDMAVNTKKAIKMLKGDVE